MTTNHGLEKRTQALSLARNGSPYPEISKRLSVPRGTIGYWVHRDRRRNADAYPPVRRGKSCPVCDDLEIRAGPYSYLLGLYLGDGHIVARYRQHHLSVFCADAWPGLIDAAEEAMSLVLPTAGTNRRQRTGCTEVKSFSMHWPCLFPQHGRGMKHTRRIVLEEWQQAIVDEYPHEFIRGLIHSDGCRVINWTTKPVAGEIKRYEYPRYHFTNESADIRDLFTGTLDRLGIAWRYNKRNCISVARREAVAMMDTFVGPKY